MQPNRKNTPNQIELVIFNASILSNVRKATILIKINMPKTATIKSKTA